MGIDDRAMLLLGIQTGPLALVAGVGEVAAVTAYLTGMHRLAGRGRRWSRWRAFSFIAGVATIWVAVGSNLAAYDERSVTLHVVQHLLLMMVAPPLLALGRPLTLAGQAASRDFQVGLLRLMRSRTVAIITFPVVTWALYYGSMAGSFMSRSAYGATIDHPLLHDASHLLFLAVGYLYWEPLVAGEATRWRLPPPARLVVILAGMPFEALIGIWVRYSDKPIDPLNTLSDTHRAGEMFWLVAIGVSTVWLGVVVIQWYARLGRDTEREDRRAGAQIAEARARAEQLGIEGVPTGWLVPSWRLAEAERTRRDGAGRVFPGPSSDPFA